MTQGNTTKVGTPLIKGTILYGIAKNELPEGFEKALRQKIRAGKLPQAARDIAIVAGNCSKDAVLFALFQAFCASDAMTPAAQFVADIAIAMGVCEE